jgi:hypothetical protein
MHVHRAIVLFCCCVIVRYSVVVVLYSTSFTSTLCSSVVVILLLLATPIHTMLIDVTCCQISNTEDKDEDDDTQVPMTTYHQGGMCVSMHCMHARTPFNHSIIVVSTQTLTLSMRTAIALAHHLR